MANVEANRPHLQETFIGPVEQNPYRRIFSEIETTSPSPISAYTHFRAEAYERGMDPIFYTPLAITSGGFGRDATLPKLEAMQRNGLYAQVAKENLLRSIPGSQASDFIIPSELGKVDGWSQADYLIFFMHIIAGLDAKEAAVVEENIGLDDIRRMTGFDDESLTFDERWGQGYKQIPEGYVALIKKYQLGKGHDGTDFPHNIQANILILDPRVSLGSNAERYLGHLLGIGEYSVSIDNPTASLTSHRQELHALGADPVILGAKRQISGGQNDANYLELRNQGFKFRKPGVLEAIWDKKALRASALRQREPEKTSEQLWAEYYGVDTAVA